MTLKEVLRELHVGYNEFDEKDTTAIGKLGAL